MIEQMQRNGNKNQNLIFLNEDASATAFSEYNYELIIQSQDFKIFLHILKYLNTYVTFMLANFNDKTFQWLFIFSNKREENYIE